MIVYQGWFDLKSGEGDLRFAEALRAYLGRLQDDGLIESYRLTRRMLGLGGEGLGEFHVQMDINDLAQLEAAFTAVSAREDPIESLHHAVNDKVETIRFALYRDFPDAHRRSGDERF